MNMLELFSQDDKVQKIFEPANTELLTLDRTIDIEIRKKVLELLYEKGRYKPKIRREKWKSYLGREKAIIDAVIQEVKSQIPELKKHHGLEEFTVEPLLRELEGQNPEIVIRTLEKLAKRDWGLLQVLLSLTDEQFLETRMKKKLQKYPYILDVVKAKPEDLKAEGLGKETMERLKGLLAGLPLYMSIGMLIDENTLVLAELAIGKKIHYDSRKKIFVAEKNG